MFPTLIQIGPLTLRTYGALIAVAFLAGLQVAKRTARLRGIKEHFLMDLAVLLIFSGLLGARLFYVILNLAYYMQHPWESLKVWEGGLVFYGGFIVAAIAGVYYARRHAISVGLIADCMAPALALGQAIGRWGCFFAGCCYGKVTTLPWAVKFKDPASLAPLGIDLHPTQLYESFGDLAIAAILWWRLVKHPDNRGDVFWLYVLLYGSLRFIVEFMRGDDRGPTMGGLYPSQVLALLAVLLAASILIAEVSAREGMNGTFTEHH